MGVEFYSILRLLNLISNGLNSIFIGLFEMTLKQNFKRLGFYYLFAIVIMFRANEREWFDKRMKNEIVTLPFVLSLVSLVLLLF